MASQLSDARRRPAHVLIVDDNQSNQCVAAAICQVLGLTCESVLNGREAIAAAETGRFDLVLMDICMPDMDGVEAALHIRELGSKTAGLPILAVTANAESKDRARYLAAGMCAVVSKPIEIPLLYQAMERALAQGPCALLTWTAQG